MLQLLKNEISSFAGDILAFGVKGDGAVQCCVRDPRILRLRRLGEGKYLAVLLAPGETEITVTAGEESATVKACVREARRSDPDGKWKIFVGDTHAHTSYSDGLATPYEVYDKVKEEEYFDFFTVTDHTELLDDDEFFETFAAADAYTDEGFTAFAGSESQVDLYHKNSIGLDQNDGGEIVVINKEGYSYSKDLDTFFSDIGENASGFAIVAHPHIMGYSEYPVVWNAFDPIHQTDARMLDLIRGIEVFNEHGEYNILAERAFSTFLDCGYKVCPVAVSDHHGPRWGKIAETNRTFVYAEKQTKEYIIDAYRNARAYACENGNVKLFYTCNGKNPASTLPPSETYEFLVHAEPFYVRKAEDETVFAEVVSDRGEIVASREVGKYMFDFDITVHSATARYFYLKLHSRSGEVTLSAPVWTGRAFDACPVPRFEKTAINDGEFKVKAFSGGSNGFSIINTDIENYCVLNDSNGEIMIDMGRVRRIGAIGYFPNRPTRHQPLTYASFASRYEYYVSLDAIRYERVAKGTVRLFGCEDICEFAPIEARYVKMRILSSVGSESRKPAYASVGASIGALRIYE